MLVSLVFPIAKSLARSDRDKYDMWHEMLHMPVVVSLLLGVIYYWISPLTDFNQKLVATGIFALSILAFPVSGMFTRTQIQRYVHHLLETASFLALLWLTAF